MKFIYLNCGMKEINVKKILAVINATYAVAKRKPEKISLSICYLNWLERCTGIAEVRVRIPASLIFSRTNLMTSSQLAC